MKDSDNQNIHTLLIGTSKTQPGEEYFCAGANVGKFWGTLSKVNTSFKGKEQTLELKKHGVFFQDISSAEGGKEKKDKEIKAISLQKGFDNLENTITNNTSIKRIGLVGKLAAQLFFIRFLNKIEKIDIDLLFKVNLFEYGKQKWTLNIGNKEIDCFVLRNTGRQWKKNPEDWIKFWNEVFK